MFRYPYLCSWTRSVLEDPKLSNDFPIIHVGYQKVLLRYFNILFKPLLKVNYYAWYILSRVSCFSVLCNRT